MKRKSKATIVDYDSFGYTQYIYYGVFISRIKVTDSPLNSYKTIVNKIDPKRIRKTLQGITDEMFSIMSNRNTKYFFPKYKYSNGYVINSIRSQLNGLLHNWKYEYKGMLNVLDEPDKFYKECIDDVIKTPNMSVFERKHHCTRLMKNVVEDNRIIMQAVYAQYILYISSQLDAVIKDSFMKKKKYISRHSRKDLYGFYEEKVEGMMKDQNIYTHHDKFISIHKFIKHASDRNYILLKKLYPNVLVENHERLYESNGANIGLLNLNDEILTNLFTDLIKFFEEYCSVVFEEDVEESKWNHGEFFLNLAADWIDMLVDPMCIDPWRRYN